MLKKRLITIPLTLVIASAMAGLSAGQASAVEEKTVETALSTEEHGYGYIPVDIDVYDVPQKKGTDLFKLGVERLPSQYRSDKEVWAQNIKVRDQKKTALCWAFSACTASEYSYAKEYYEETGEILDLETSPSHLAQNFYCRENDPLGNTAGDYNGIKEHWALLGGNMIYGMFHMATWSGLVSEETAPFSETNDRVTKDNK